MRMWGAKPENMCRQHLLGEHLELHMFATTIKNKQRVSGYSKTNCLDVKRIKSRHDEIVIEMGKRGYNHKTPISENPNYDYLPDEIKNKNIDIESSIKTLLERCSRCREQSRK